MTIRRKLGEQSGVVARSMPPSSQAVRRSLATQGLGGTVCVRRGPPFHTLYSEYSDEKRNPPKRGEPRHPDPEREKSTIRYIGFWQKKTPGTGSSPGPGRDVPEGFCVTSNAGPHGAA